MGFYWIGFVFWTLIFTSIICVVWGIWKKSASRLVIGAILFVPIAYYFSGAENHFKYIMLTPIVFLIMAFVVKKQEASF
ncbi:hypothetical protein CD798_15420 [Bacillaceae bacterium SAOS 7]|nr:hypothetical protein CD798_15420 [Bacillaceae bacterium SAOS 7]